MWSNRQASLGFPNFMRAKKQKNVIIPCVNFAFLSYFWFFSSLVMCAIHVASLVVAMVSNGKAMLFSYTPHHVYLLTLCSCECLEQDLVYSALPLYCLWRSSCHVKVRTYVQKVVSSSFPGPFPVFQCCMLKSMSWKDWEACSWEWGCVGCILYSNTARSCDDAKKLLLFLQRWGSLCWHGWTPLLQEMLWESTSWATKKAQETICLNL